MRRKSGWRGGVAVIAIAGVVAGLILSGATVASSKPPLTIAYGGNVSLAILAEAEAAAKLEAAKLGVKLIIANSDNASEQVPALKALLAQHPAALSVDPWDSSAIGTVVKQANALKIPVVMWISADLGGGKTATYIAGDDVSGSEAVAARIFKQMGGKGQVAYIDGDPAIYAHQQRFKGYQLALKKDPGIKQVAFGIADDDTLKARNLALNMLTAHPGIKAILTGYDGMTEGAVSALASLHKSVLTSGVDGECPMLQLIWQGKATATFDQLWANISSLSIEDAVAAAQGKTLPARVVTPSFTIDKAAMQQIKAGTYTGASGQPLDYLKRQVQNASTGCKKAL
jgi:ABC-type sugar transport system substrate-binding protein